ncbi:hypothetical protein H6P81_004422 [Aristolochia fimbriata]|uniref:Uncharacterized protein n=1 Tax=Aristolochia fimbriata TaxID=158543 RepID=A0AAV7FFW0_ARIFI|nr:hypothetical protein H6P81_004422 [Aristolochia fimbriata]
MARWRARTIANDRSPRHTRCKCNDQYSTANRQPPRLCGNKTLVAAHTLFGSGRSSSPSFGDLESNRSSNMAVPRICSTTRCNAKQTTLYAYEHLTRPVLACC